ncbi:MAG: GNAT family N-acetyltransferase [Planctomycetota bacterium]
MKKACVTKGAPVAVSFATARCVCRPLRRADIDACCGWDPRPVRRTSAERRTRADRLVTRWTAMRRRWFACELAGTGRLVALISLRDHCPRAGAWRLGMEVAPKLAGRGYGTEILKGFLEHYFDTLKGRLLMLDVARSNARARHVYTRCGFRLRGSFRRPDPEAVAERVERGRPTAVYDEMAVTRREWRAARNAAGAATA